MEIQNLNKLFDLEYFEGPLISLFAGSDGKFFIFKWFDINDSSHQWLVFQVNFETLADYLNGTVSEYKLLTYNLSKPFYIVEFTERGTPKVVSQIEGSAILSMFQNLSKVYFSQEYCPNWLAVKNFFHPADTKTKKPSSKKVSYKQAEYKILITEEKGQFYVTLTSNSGQIILKSVGYPNKKLATQGAEAITTNFELNQTKGIAV
ncbi:MAG: YegP family protein [Saprospiraceae bacterium]|nr:YegP family protein [Saprospiraceae bacterium]